jgi:hypothetical protein
MMLKFSSNPIRMAIELRYSQIRITIDVPIEPYSLLYCPKLFTYAENPSDVRMNNNVARIEPVEKNLKPVLLAGAK